MIRVRYTMQKIPDYENSIFLAGPTIRSYQRDYPSWRTDAINYFKQIKDIDLTIIVPQWRNKVKPQNWTYLKQIKWETKNLNNCKLIMFWIPRQKQRLIGLTTNVQFGQWYKSGKIVVGSPIDSYKNDYLKVKANDVGLTWYNDLYQLVNQCKNNLLNKNF